MINQKKETIINFKKVESLTGKIIKMIEDDEYCIDIMQHNLAAIGLLKSAHQKLLENHLHTCFESAMSTNNKKKKKQMSEEILKVMKLSNK